MPPRPDAPDKGTIAIAFVHEALAEVRRRGLEEGPILTAAGISPELLHTDQARVSSERYGLLWHGIAQLLDDEFFGMDRHPMKTGSFTLLCHAVLHATTLEQALRRALRFLRLVLDGLAGELVVQGETATVRLLEPGSAADAPPRRAFAYGTFLLIVHGLACWLVGRRIPLSRADFRCAEPAYSGEWRVLFSPQLAFDQPCSAIHFPAHYLAMATVPDEGAMRQFLRRAPANFLIKFKNSAGLTARIRRRLREIPPEAWPDFDTLARRLHHSPATLRRRLEGEGQTYRNIKEDLRRDLAIYLLCHSPKCVAEIAADLGFAEASAFHRAFKKWTGARPGEYRQSLRPPATLAGR
ncbi:AraC family transcriptional regulator [Azospira inquinata]|uniref:AraC family transcriptional regulator n=1 Tax=Azospira inquinata TaxID=2785627 RepID=A0A975XV46_9RHOO|nr:AraC family transcriptional regulator [Azospira inquinata]QWT45194.1 AraC family transcriptional regulator [Azospira inquinata]QWT49473.1 AraC family transcriptional regulator [Azospira inquinata]